MTDKIFRVKNGLAVNNTLLFANNGVVGVNTATPRTSFDVASNDAIVLPAGNTGQRPSPVNGMIRFNTDTGGFEGYNSGWAPVGGATSPGGSNTFVEFNDSGSLGGSAGFTFNKATNNVTIANTLTLGSVFYGNSTANVAGNSTNFSFANSTSTTNIGPLGVTVGANVIVNSVAHFTGNSTVNSFVNSSLIQVSNSTGVANLTPISVTIGGIVQNTTGFFAGANVISNTSTVFVGNSTVNASMTATQIQVANSTGTLTLTPTSFSLGGAVHNTSGFFIGNSIVNSSALSADLYTGAGIGATSDIWANTANKVIQTDKLVRSTVYQTLTDAATIAYTMANGLCHIVTSGGNRTLANPSVIIEGRTNYLKYKQDVTGGRTLAFGNCYVFNYNTVPTINTTASTTTLYALHAITSSNVLVTVIASGIPV